MNVLQYTRAFGGYRNASDCIATSLRIIANHRNGTMMMYLLYEPHLIRTNRRIIFQCNLMRYSEPGVCAKRILSAPS